MSLVQLHCSPGVDRLVQVTIVLTLGGAAMKILAKESKRTELSFLVMFVM